MLNRFLSGTIFAFLLISLGITAPAQAKTVAHDPDGGDEIAVKHDPDGGDEAVKGTKGTINVTVGAAVGDKVAGHPDGGEKKETKKKKMSANEASASGALKTIAA